LENEVHQHTLAASRADHEISQLLDVGCIECYLVLCAVLVYICKYITLEELNNSRYGEYRL